ncbi:hypothetical protein PIB30_070040 [Stylosanthes scabra]|uniref:Uncharacterized protein n=1 Tax=Stylosanthes scabra TaxID=79078 RepID=A0ABU6RNX7_9FABA|nr:hypothetical protein [Stylosanthes scabra]
MADEEILDSHCFLILFNQRLFDETVSKKKIIPEVGFNLSDGTYPKIEEQIRKRGWRRLASPRDEVAKALVREFYANVGRTDEHWQDWNNILIPAVTSQLIARHD